MRIRRYFSILVILAAASFLVSTSLPATSLAATGDSNGTKIKATKTTKAKNLHNKTVRSAKGPTKLVKPKIAQNQPAPVAKPWCVQCSTVTGPAWGTPATSGSGTGQANTPRVICSTCVPSWNVPATNAGSITCTPEVVCTNTCTPCNNVPTTSWNVPATAGSTASSYTPPPAQESAPAQQPAPAPAAAAAPAAQTQTGCGLLCSVLQVPYNIGRFVFGGCLLPSCS